METTTYKLGEVLDNFDYLRKPLSSMERASFQGEYPYYGAQGIIDYVREYRCDGTYMLIAEDGENLSSRKEPIALIAKGKFWVNNHAHIVKTNELADLNYICYLLNHSDIAGYITGSAQPKLSQGNLNKIKISLPSLPLQRRIASILSAYDNLIEANSRRIKILEQMAENLYKEWFVRFRFPNYQNTPIENGIPKGWKVERLKDFGITLTSGSRPKGGIDANLEEGVPSLGAESIKGLAEFDYSSVKLVPQEFYCQMKRGKNTGNDILLYKDGAYIGKTTLFRDGFPFKTYSINEHVFIISPIDQEYKNYLYFTLHQEAFFYLMQNLNRNAAQPGLSNNDINNIKVMIPNKELIAQYNLHVEPILKEIFKLAHQSANLTRQRDLLLPRLMSGQLTPLTNQ